MSLRQFTTSEELAGGAKAPLFLCEDPPKASLAEDGLTRSRMRKFGRLRCATARNIFRVYLCFIWDSVLTYWGVS